MNDDDYVFFLFSQYCDESFVIIRKIFTVLCTFMHINIVFLGLLLVATLIYLSANYIYVSRFYKKNDDKQHF